MKIDKSKISKVLLIIVLLAILLMILVNHFHGGYHWIKVERQLEKRYGCNIKLVSEKPEKNKDGIATEFISYKIMDEDGNECYVYFSKIDGISEDDLANVVYSKKYVEDIEKVTDNYFDEYICIPNFFEHNPGNIPYENSGSFEDYDAYIKESGIRLDYTILIREDTDISSMDELIKEYEKTFSDRNIAIAIEQVPDDIYDGNAGVSCYQYLDYYYARMDYKSYFYSWMDDTQFMDFVKRFGTAQFMYMNYNYYNVGSYNL